MSSRWAIDVYEETPSVLGWLLDQPEKPMGWSPPKEPKVRPNKKPTKVPPEHAKDTCKKDGGAAQCCYLHRNLGDLYCIKHTSFMKRADENLNVVRGIDFSMLAADDVRRSYPAGNNCEGAQMLDPSIFQNYEANRKPTVIPGLTISQFEDTLVECLRKANEHYNQVIDNRHRQDKSHSPADRLGIFCTSLRSQLSMYSEKLACGHTRWVLDHLRRTENWSSVLTPKASGTYVTYNHQPHTLYFIDGAWTLNHDKIAELSRAAQSGYRFVTEETKVQTECTASLLLVERSIPTLNALADQARQINIESDRVLANMMSIAESLER